MVSDLFLPKRKLWQRPVRDKGDHANTKGNPAFEQDEAYQSRYASIETPGPSSVTNLKRSSAEEIYNEVAEEDYNTVFGGKETGDYHMYSLSDIGREGVHDPSGLGSTTPSANLRPKPPKPYEPLKLPPSGNKHEMPGHNTPDISAYESLRKGQPDVHPAKTSTKTPDRDDEEYTELQQPPPNDKSAPIDHTYFAVDPTERSDVTNQDEQCDKLRQISSGGATRESNNGGNTYTTLDLNKSLNTNPAPGLDNKPYESLTHFHNNDDYQMPGEGDDKSTAYESLRDPQLDTTISNNGAIDHVKKPNEIPGHPTTDDDYQELGQDNSYESLRNEVPDAKSGSSRSTNPAPDEDDDESTQDHAYFVLDRTCGPESGEMTNNEENQYDRLRQVGKEGTIQESTYNTLELTEPIGM